MHLEYAGGKLTSIPTRHMYDAGHRADILTRRDPHRALDRTVGLARPEGG